MVEDSSITATCKHLGWLLPPLLFQSDGGHGSMRQQSLRSVLIWPVLFAIISTLALPVAAQPLRFESIGIEDGLPQLSVTCMAQDDQGFLWVGTQSGLARFDGYEFKVFRSRRSRDNWLTDSYIEDLEVGPDGALWIATATRGINHYDPVDGQFSAYVAQDESASGLAGNRIVALDFDQANGLYGATRGAGLSRIDVLTGEVRSWQEADDAVGGLPDNNLRDVLVLDDSEVWLAASTGLIRFFPQENRFELVANDELNSVGLTRLAVDGDGTVWLGSEHDGLFHVSRSGEIIDQFVHEDFEPDSLPGNQVASLLVDSQNNLWVGTTEGLGRYDRINAGFQVYRNDPLDAASISANRIASIFEGQDGVLWFGSWIGGLNKSIVKNTRFKVYRQSESNPRGLPDNRVRDFLQAPGEAVWIATLGGGITRFVPSTEQFFTLRHDPFNPNSLTSDDIHALARDANGDIWVGSRDAGLDRLNPATGEVIHYPHVPGDDGSLRGNHVLDLMTDRTGKLWVGLWDAGAAAIDTASMTYTHYTHDPDDPNSLAMDTVGVLYQDRRGRIWLGTRGGGLSLYRPETNDFFSFRPQPHSQDGLVHGTITDFAEKDGELWISTQGGGFGKLIEKDADLSKARFKFYTVEDGLAGDAIGAIEFDEYGNLWISTLLGLTEFNPETEEFRNYRSPDGTQAAGYYVGSGFTSDRGTIYFGGVDGFTVFKPSPKSVEVAPPPIYLTELLIANSRQEPRWLQPDSPLPKEVEFTDTVDLDHTQQVFSIEFTGLDYIEPGALNYRYRMQGFDSDWLTTNAQRRIATYTNLGAGDYQFEVEVSDRMGNWTGNLARLSINLATPPWRTVWAYLAYALMIFLIMSGYFYSRRRAQRAEAAAEAAERKGEERLKLALWGSGDEMWFLDLRDSSFKRIYYWEGSTETPFAPLDTLDEFWRVVHPDDRDQIRNSLMTHLKKERPYFESTYRVMQPDGTQTWNMSRGRVVEEDDDGRAIIVAGATKDVTAVMRAEQALRELNEKLERLVEERTEKLQESNESLAATLRQLQAAQTQLVESEKMASLGGLVAGVAHEINTPIGVAVTAASHLANQFDRFSKSEEAHDADALARMLSRNRENIDFIMDNLRRASGLIRSFKQVAVDQSSEELRQFKVCEYIEEILSSLRPQLKRSNHEVVVHCEDGIEMHSYPGALYQVLSNLVMNSLVHGYDEGEAGTMHISAEREGHSLHLRYSDDGRGLSENVAAKIFEPFFTTKRGAGGSGLGMHIAYNLVTQVMRGSITVEAKPGNGFVANLVLPLKIDSGLDDR